MGPKQATDLKTLPKRHLYAKSHIDFSSSIVIANEFWRAFHFKISPSLQPLSWTQTLLPPSIVLSLCITTSGWSFTKTGQMVYP